MMAARIAPSSAVECVFKPFRETALLDALNMALRTGHA
jgi:FixJ family two-component response regulator